MPAERSTKKDAAPTARIPKNVKPCIICGKVVSRTSDIARHMKKHDSEAKKIACPWEGCTFSTLQKSNLDTHYRRHTQDKSYLCQDDHNCHFQTVDPACLLRHRKRMHGYVPRPSNRRHTGTPSNAQASPRPENSIYSSVKLAFSTLSSLFDRPASPPTETFNLLPLNESFCDLYPCSYDYTWDGFLQSGSLATQPEIQQFRFHQDQQENCQQLNNLFPLQVPNAEKIFPGYETTGQLHGPYGLDLNLRVFHPSPELADLAMSTNAPNAQLHQVPSVPHFNNLVNLQTYPSPDPVNLYASTINHYQLTNLNGEIPNAVDLHIYNSQSTDLNYQIPGFINSSAPNLDYFDQFR